MEKMGFASGVKKTEGVMDSKSDDEKMNRGMGGLRSRVRRRMIRMRLIEGIK